MSEDNRCPYCGKLLEHPYWAHVQAEHPEEYKKNQTWIKLYKDYTSMGMDQQKSLAVIAELFNQSIEDVKFYLEQNDAL
ncbi:MAG: hypothetical protein BAJALOKI1v1_1210013 [Promethearchaeota archaeon]|nr:MAG: hypothetical protein BAJALOKI1v1_1210013 [Candidatus Lokiarchaeota archaeon]